MTYLTLKHVIQLNRKHCNSHLLGNIIKQQLGMDDLECRLSPERCLTAECVLLSQIEQVSQLAALVQAQVEYHSRSAEILTQLSSEIDER